MKLMVVIVFQNWDAVVVCDLLDPQTPIDGKSDRRGELVKRSKVNQTNSFARTLSEISGKGIGIHSFCINRNRQQLSTCASKGAPSWRVARAFHCNQITRRQKQLRT